MVKEKRFNWVYKKFLDSLKFIKHCRNYIFFATFVFVFFGILGYVFPNLFREELLQIIKDLIDQTAGLKSLDLISFIITNNIKSSFFALFFGIFFGILPFLIIVINGFLLGFVANLAVSSEGWMVLWKLLPHGFFEIPAVLISVGVGIKLGLFFFNTKDKRKSIAAFFISFMYFFLFVGFASLIISFYSSFNGLDMNPKTIIDNSKYLGVHSLVLVVMLLFSIYLSSFLFTIKERRDLRKNFFIDLKDAFFAFIFLVVPLLVIAGIIEGILISIFG